ncbi:hypothetical protein [Methanogenium organophilum]|uniref:Uncharacterized protein n=1 Tax=Methanogenium organophilum TaxID=2199 RepID=A0A9X9S2B6_METOG|nr:hypothetical protein [Methanogenium organophilum]WAI00247.1 hypothetical protein OU421_07340 [Methanogenium organophilum]
MNAKEMLGILLACVLNICMVVLAIYDGQSFSWIFPMLTATLGAIVGSSGVPKCEYRNTSWKRAWRYGREGLSIGIITGIISAVLILAYASLANPEAFSGTNGSLYAAFIGLIYIIPSIIGGFFGGEIQSGIRGNIVQTS